jgi:hypothetical protein
MSSHRTAKSRSQSASRSRSISTLEKAIVTLLAFQSLQGNDPNLNLGELGTFKEEEAVQLNRTIQELAKKYDTHYSENIQSPASFASNRPSNSRLQKTLRRFRKIAAKMTGMRGTFSGRGNVPALNR